MPRVARLPVDNLVTGHLVRYDAQGVLSPREWAERAWYAPSRTLAWSECRRMRSIAERYRNVRVVRLTRKAG